MIVGGATRHAEATTVEDLAVAARAVLAEGFTGARAAKELSRRTGVSRDEAYRAALAARGDV